MSAKIIDGKAVAAQCRAELKIQVEALKAEGITPGLAVVLVGEDSASYPRSTPKRMWTLSIRRMWVVLSLGITFLPPVRPAVFSPSSIAPV